MNEKNIFNLQNKKTDLFAGMPYEKALAFIEQSNFKLLLSNNYIDYFGEKNHRIYYHEKSGIILKANNDKSNKLEDIHIYYQIEANYQPDVWGEQLPSRKRLGFALL